MRRWLLIQLLLICGTVAAQPPAIAIVLDDLGNSLSRGRQAVALPGRITYAFLPQTPHVERLSRQVHASARESIVHLPMQSLNRGALGPGGLTLEMSDASLQQTLLQNLHSVPFAVGANNHMGSSMTQDLQAMSKVMSLLASHTELFFLDSRTHELTVAEQAANQAGIPNTRRDVFLDNQRDQNYIAGQLNLLLEKARASGTAVAIGHPYPETLAVLARWLPQLNEQGVDLISLSSLIERQSAENPHRAMQNQSMAGINCNSSLATCDLAD